MCVCVCVCVCVSVCVWCVFARMHVSVCVFEHMCIECIVNDNMYVLKDTLNETLLQYTYIAALFHG